MKHTLTFALLALLIVGCTSNTQEKERPLYQGNQGLILTFPDKNSFTLYEQDLFSIALRLENDGATHVRNGYVNVLYDPALVSLTSARSRSGPYDKTVVSAGAFPFSVLGRTRDISVGELEYLDFTFEAQPIAGNREKSEALISFQVCYPYNTTFIKTLCVDRDVFGAEESPVCKALPVSDASQGAPIAVTKVEPTVLRNNGIAEPRYKVTVQNLQDGYTLFGTGDAAALCNQRGFNRTEFNKIKVSAKLNNVPLTCGTDNSGVVRFERDTAEIVCRLPGGLPPGANYETALVVEVQYFYISTVTAKVEVANVD